MACISSTLRCGTRRDSVFLKGIAKIRQIRSSADGSRYSRKCRKDLMAVSLMFREVAANHAESETGCWLPRRSAKNALRYVTPIDAAHTS